MKDLVVAGKISEAGRALVRSYREIAHKSSAVLFWGDADTGKIENQASCVFVRLETSVVALTAGHVAEGMQDFIENGGTACRLGSSNFFPPAPPRFHPNYPIVDLAVFDVGQIFAEVADVHPVSIRDWPIPTCNTNDLVVLGGFPGTFRVERELEVDNEFLFFAGRFDGVSDGKMRIVLNLGNANSLSGERVTPGFRLGGMSGGPVFRHVESGFIERIELAGIITDGIDSYEVIFGTELTTLRNDGSFGE